MQDIDFDAACAETWDFVVAGTSFSAMFFARELPAAARILLIEKGERHTHAERVAGRTQFGRETIRQRNTSGHEKEWIANSTFGGNSNCWWACTPRLHPEDFAMRTRFGVAQDWPVTYDELEPLYGEVEEIMDVCGGGSDAQIPRSRPFPSPPMRPSRSDVALRKHRADWWAQPTARSNGTRRPKCCGNGVCAICPIDAKFTIVNTLGTFERPNVRVLLRAEVRALHRSAGRVAEAEVRDPDGRVGRIRGGVFALGANALFNTAILLRSGFQNPALGRYLHEQASQVLLIDTAIENYLGQTSVTGHGYGFYAGEHRRERAAVMIENWNSPAFVRPEPGKWTQRLAMKLLAEDLPREDNRVVLEDGEPMIEWRGHDPYAFAGLAWAEAHLGELLPTPIEGIERAPFTTTEAHIQGTHRMAATPDLGVVDGLHRCFEADNVLALGGGAFPSCSPANPSLTISVLAMRAGRAFSSSAPAAEAAP